MQPSRRFLGGRLRFLAILALALLGGTGVSDPTWAFSLPKKTSSPQSGSSVSPRPVYREVGRASWYGPGFYGRPTASGERLKPHKLTAAHRRLPLGTTAKVTNLANGKQVKVKINDRGPYVRGRTLDLSPAAAQQLGMAGKGTAPIKLQVLSSPAASNDSTAGTGPQGGSSLSDGNSNRFLRARLAGDLFVSAPIEGLIKPFEQGAILSSPHLIDGMVNAEH